MTMIRTKPILDLCRNIKTGGFVIMNFAQDEFGMSVAAGKLVSLSADQVKTMGLDIVLTHLNDYPNRRPDNVNELNRMTSVQKRKFFKAHSVLDIRLEKSSLLHIGAIHGFTGRTHTGQPWQAWEMPLPATNEQFLAVLDKAFSYLENPVEDDSK